MLGPIERSLQENAEYYPPGDPGPQAKDGHTLDRAQQSTKPHCAHRRMRRAPRWTRPRGPRRPMGRGMMQRPVSPLGDHATPPSPGERPGPRLQHWAAGGQLGVDEFAGGRPPPHPRHSAGTGWAAAACGAFVGGPAVVWGSAQRRPFNLYLSGAFC